LTLGSNNKYVDTQATQELKSIRAWRLRELESATEWLSTERGLRNTNKNFRRQETGERLQESYGKQQQKLLKQMHHSVQKLQ